MASAQAGSGGRWARIGPSVVFGWALLTAGYGLAGELGAPQNHAGTNVQTFQVQGVVRELPADGRTVVIAHEAVGSYMGAMTMPFKVKDPAALAGLRTGDKVRFRLKVTDTESWIEDISKVGTAQVAAQTPRLSGRHLAVAPNAVGTAPRAAEGTTIPLKRNPLLDYPFTNELGQPVRLSDFRGQALAVTFFFTRCPIPDYCPRLAKNFEEAEQKLSALPGGPTNWHFLSVTFDPEFDRPSVLKAYGERYHYDPKRWNFLTGPWDKISELAEGAGVKLEHKNGFISHNFRTLIVNAAGHLQTVFPMGGNLSDAIVGEVLKAAAVSPGGLPEPKDSKPPPQTAAVAR